MISDPDTGLLLVFDRSENFSLQETGQDRRLLTRPEDTIPGLAQA
jgi:hypothetical protein